MRIKYLNLVKIFSFSLMIAPVLSFGQLPISGKIVTLASSCATIKSALYKNAQDTGSIDITRKLKAYSLAHFTEKAYLHFDKPYYAIGDTIYFKAYVTMGERHRLSELSGILRVDLVDEHNQLVQRKKLKLERGMAWGDFALSDTLTDGNYRVRAYTAWMQNDPGSFYSQNIPVRRALNNKVPESDIQHHKINNKADMQFMPESGNFVTGIKSKIAFKAVGRNGLGVNAKGVVLDNDDKQVAEFATSHLGMGYFYLEPMPGKVYRAKVTFDGGIENSILLPHPVDQGIVLEVNNDSLPVASVKIRANESYFAANKSKPYSLLIYSGGVAVSVNFNLDSVVTALDIVKRKLFTGVATITLFSANEEPLAERLIFIQNYDQLNIDAQTDAPKYQKRGKVSINLNVTDRANEMSAGHFSVSVIDGGKVQQDEDDAHTLLSDLLLTSDLKGYVEKPNYYFTDVTRSKLNELDLVMLTHGYRKFEWKTLIAGGYPPPAYQLESGLQISGTAAMTSGRMMKNGSVALFSIKKGLIAMQKTDQKGGFLFTGLPLIDSDKLILQAQNGRGNNGTKLTYNEGYPINTAKAVISSQPVLPVDMSAYLENEKLWQGMLPKGKLLKEVKIKTFKRDDDYVTSSLAGAGNADQVMHADQISQVGGQLVTALMGRLHGVTFDAVGFGFRPRLTGSWAPMLVIIDGVEDADISTLSSQEVGTVEVLKSGNASIYGMRGGNGVLVITTKHLDPKYIESIGILPITFQGFYKAREFYSPKYEAPYMANRTPDLRSTIYWQPELTTGKDGKASFEYYNADGPGLYKVVIEGIDNNGNLGRRVLTYQVE